jgi:hypothetical protein
MEEELKNEREQGEGQIEEIHELIVVTNELREEIRAVREAHEFEGGPSHGLLGGSLAEQLDTDEKGERLEVRCRMRRAGKGECWERGHMPVSFYRKVEKGPSPFGTSHSYCFLLSCIPIHRS